MTYHQAVESGTKPLGSWFPYISAEKPKVPVAILQEIIADVRRALGQDANAVRSGLERLSAMLDGKVTPAVPAYTRGGFAPWQKRRIEAYLLEHLGESVSIKTLAEMVSLSPSHFCRAFKQSFGKTPHTYLVGMRIERAKQMMLSTGEPLSQIALACGLADQSHFSRAFLRCVGQSPAMWRRLNVERN